MTIEEFRGLISDYHSVATTMELVEHRKSLGFKSVLTRLVFYFETLQISDEEELKQGADRVFYFINPRRIVWEWTLSKAVPAIALSSLLLLASWHRRSTNRKFSWA